MKITLHCRPGYTPFLAEVVKKERTCGGQIAWSAILYSNADEQLEQLSSLLGREHILYLQALLNENMREESATLGDLAQFPASIYRCVLSTKHTAGIHSLLQKPREYQLRLITSTYLRYKEFLLRERPDFVLFSLIELYDAVVLYHLCLELGIRPMIYAQARNVSLSYFSESIFEELPKYATEQMPSASARARAQEYVSSFRQSFVPPFQITSEPAPDDVIHVPGVRGMSIARLRRMACRIVSRVRGLKPVGGIVAEPHLADTYTWGLKFKAALLPVTKQVRAVRGRFQGKYFDIARTEDLPEKFIYYPLQFSPEASINIPSPYFVEQMRAIDLLLLNMPADYRLVVKEHPVMVGVRPTGFYRELRRRASVLVADAAVSGREIVSRASLTVSVTGTSCFEALLLGRPALHLGRTFFTDWIASFDSFAGLNNLIRELLSSSKVDSERAVDLVSRILDVGGEFFLFAVDDAYRSYDHVMNRNNVQRFLEAVRAHVDRVSRPGNTGTAAGGARGVFRATTVEGNDVAPASFTKK